MVSLTVFLPTANSFKAKALRCMTTLGLRAKEPFDPAPRPEHWLYVYAASKQRSLTINDKVGELHRNPYPTT